MVTADRMRKLALSMPETEEKSHFAQPDFRVRDKIFAGLSRDGARANLKLAPEIQASLVGDETSPFTPCAGAWGRSGWTYVDLATVDAAMLADLVAEAWRLVAPKTLVVAYDETRSLRARKVLSAAQPDTKKKAKAAATQRVSAPGHRKKRG